VTLSVTGRTIAIDVIDNGKGFPRENRQRLLEPYMTTRAEGTGLGLPIVAKILADHGGGLELRDAPMGAGLGSDSIFLGATRRRISPMNRIKPRLSRRRENREGSHGERYPDRRRRADIRDIVSGILSDEGHGARTAKNSDEALAAIEARRPNLVFLDIWLQGSRLDGLQLLKIIKEQNPMLPV